MHYGRSARFLAFLAAPITIDGFVHFSNVSNVATVATAVAAVTVLLLFRGNPRETSHGTISYSLREIAADRSTKCDVHVGGVSFSFLFFNTVATCAVYVCMCE